MASVQFTASKVLERKSKEIIAKIEEQMAESADDVLELLTRRMTKFDKVYHDGDGVGVENRVETSMGSASKWRKTRLRGKERNGNIVYQFRNDATGKNGYNYTKHIYGPAKHTRDSLHKNGFRSAYRHLDDRPNQLNKAKWLGFKKFAAMMLKNRMRIID